jgi:hypothetical protein
MSFPNRIALIAGFLAVAAAAPATAENVPADRLQALADVMPAAPKDFTRQPRLGTYSSASASTATATYEAEDGRAFDIVVTFSAENVKQNRDLLKDKAQRDMFGMDAQKIKGRDGLARKAANKNASVAVFVVVLTDSRVVSVTDAFGTTDPAVLKAIVEATDFDAIAKR